MIGSRAWVAEQFEGVVAELKNGRPEELWIEIELTAKRWLSLGGGTVLCMNLLRALVELQCSLTGDNASVVMHSVGQMLAKGQREYGGEGDAFEQFKEAAGDLDLDPQEVLCVYAQKHMVGIRRHFAGEVSQREPVTNRVLDLMVYVVLSRFMGEAA